MITVSLATLALGSSEGHAATGSAPPTSVGARSAGWSAFIDTRAVPRAVYGEGSYLVPLSLRNTGIHGWPAVGPDAVRISYHWFRSNGSIAVWDGQRTSMTQPVPPGGSASVSAVVVVPQAPGRYRIQFDLISGGSGWFSEQGWSAPTISITVGRTASRLFAAHVSPVQLPEVLSAHSVNVVTVRLTNSGTAPWPNSGRDAVFLSYHWLRLDGSYAVWDGRRTTLTRPVNAAASIEQPLVVEAPGAAGRYALRVDPISLEVGWFSRLGSVATPSSAIEVADAGGVHASSGSPARWALVAVLLIALAVGVLVFRRRRLQGEHVIESHGDTAAAIASSEVDDLAPAIVGSPRADRGHRPDVADRARPPRPANLTAPTSSVVTAGASSSNGSSRHAGTEMESSERRVTAPSTEKPAAPRARPHSLADYMRARGALGDR